MIPGTASVSAAAPTSATRELQGTGLNAKKPAAGKKNRGADLFAVLKPLLRQLTAVPRLAGPSPGQAGALSAPAGDGAQGAPGNGGMAAGGQPPAQLAASSNSIAYEQQVAQARTVVAQDPARVAQVVKTWVSADG